MSNAAVIVESRLEKALRKMNVCYNKSYENKGTSFEIIGSRYNVSVFDTGDEFLCNTTHATNKTEAHIKIYKTIRGVTGFICRWLEK
ncbi:hypothetical protein ACFVL4_13700 [Bacillus subtilis]|uniref:Uncharacterized protein n=1 Tax=Bacillus subtilis TaxID=1423 RepID=A0A1J0AKL4_BACIU|nr:MULTISPECIES: hypothetical protein [Bacillus]APB62279.1 hypothetical protein pBS72_0100 [Bacillus subtilis]MEC2297447.1 hypothetical protein [Bacillus subtilis]MEC3664914.1 hypothetical protein [Bacillus subtilis]NUF07766.1 hypothetical protein [Bacillus rugosus]ODV48179.1 hypothetical protein BCM26_04320 [Bacillus subtilis]